MAAADTAVLYMAAGEAESVKAALIAAGKPATTPIALAENISLPGARCLSGVLGNLPQIARRLGEGRRLSSSASIRFCAARFANNYDPDPEFEREPERVEESTANQPSDHSAIEKPRKVQSTTAHSPVPETRVQRPREREVLQHEVEVGAALRHAIGRKVLQPDLARGDGEAAGGESAARLP